MRGETNIEISRPFTIEFEIIRNSLASNNVGSFRIYNLHPRNRNRIRKDPFATYELGRLVSFKAGYGKTLSLAFTGLIGSAWSMREGVDFITQIECFDGGFSTVNDIINMSAPKGSPVTSVIDDVISQMTGVTRGAIGAYGGELPRGNAYSGTAMNVLSELAGRGAYVDNGAVHCLGDKECIATPAPPTINAKTGLLGTPVRQGQYLNFDMLFEPSLKVGQLIRLESSTTDNPDGVNAVNGIHKIISLRHSGTISDAVAGNAITSVGVLPGVFNEITIGAS